MRLMFTPSLSTPRNSDALPVPVGRKPILIMRKDGWGTLHMAQEEWEGISLSYRGQVEMEDQGSAMGTPNGADLLEALCGWSDSPELLEALAVGWFT